MYNPNRKGTGFTNVNKLLQANQGSRLGQAVAGTVSEQAQGAQTGLQKSQEQFKQESEQNQTDTEQNKEFRQGILGRFQQPVQDVSKPIVSEEETKKFQQLGSGAYAGPRELRDYQSVLGQAQKAQQFGELTKSQGGRQELLKQTVGGRGYTPGQQRLDTAVLGNQQGNQLRAARRETMGVSGDVRQANTLAQQQAQELTGRAQSFGQETKGLLGQTREPISGQVDTRLSELTQGEQQRQQQYGEMQNILRGTGNYQYLSPEERAGIALSAGVQSGDISQPEAQLLSKNLARARSLGLNIGTEVLNRMQDIQAQGLNRAGVVSEDERAKLNALDILSGKQQSNIEFGSDPFQRYSAGRTKYDIGSLDKYLSKLEAQKAQKEWEEANWYRNLTDTEKAMYGVGQATQGAAIPISNALDQGSVLGTASAIAGLGGPGDLLTGSNNFQTNVGAISQTGQGLARANYYGQQAMNDQLLKEGLGLKEDNEIYKALNKVMTVGDSTFEKGLATGADYLSGIGNTANLLRQGDVLQAAKNYAGVKQQQEVAKKAAEYAAQGLDIIKDKAGNIVGTVKKPVSSVGGSVSKAIKKYCFDGHTKVLMDDGTYKKVRELKLGDKTALGGKITNIGQAYADDLYNINGVKVTGAHAALQPDGRWVRVEDLDNAIPVGKDGVVYPITNERHILLTEGQVWADYQETDSDLPDSQSLDEMNENSERNRLLLEFSDKYFNRSK